ncbi:MAG: hypothetical protein C0522_11715 [Rhodocyclaceae bacterium]|nr:hypothetical protein [Rhodocyclaceae bacterium]
MISGFVIAMASRATLSFRQAPFFFARRMVRLIPPYWVAVAIAFAVLALQAGVSGKVHVPSAVTVLANLVYVQDVLGYDSVNVVFWTLCIEVQFYLAFAMAVAVVRRGLGGGEMPGRSALVPALVCGGLTF